MRHIERPLVSVVTPVYNGALYLRECIESVLAQTLECWEYIIVNNCSEDDTLKIAEEYASKDCRIRCYSNDALLPIIANHNKALGLISSDSEYCKIVSADDWLYPECLARMVELAKENPSVGIVGAYQLSGGDNLWYVRNHGLPFSRRIISGREACRCHLLGTLSVFGNPTSNLYRADLVRGSREFFPNPTAEADVSACLQHLHVCDFGFVHQVLSYERLHESRVTTVSLKSNAYLSAAIGDCITYGKWFLSADECKARVNELLKQYYKYLSANALKHREKAFWLHHEKRLRELGFPLDRRRLSLGILGKLIDLVLHPMETIQLVMRRMHGVIARRTGGPAAT